MSETITPDQIVGAAKELEVDEFTRAQLAEKLGIKAPAMKQGFKEARKSDRLLKVGEDDEGTGLFRLTSS